MNLEIKKIGAEHIEGYLDVYLNAYSAYKSLDLDCRAYYREKTLIDMKDSGLEFFSAFADDKIVANMKIVHFEMNVFGRMEKAFGLMALGVHPMYKKRGIAFEMVKFFERYSKDSGALLSILLPFNIGFYRRMGYGYSQKIQEYTIQTGNLPKHNCDHLDYIPFNQIAEILRCHNEFVKECHGMITKFNEEIRGMVSDEALQRIGYYENGVLKGYALFRLESADEENYTLNRIVVEEMIYENGEILKAFLGFFRNQEDQYQTIVLRSGEENFHHLFDNPQDVSNHYIPFGFMQTNVEAIGTMFKILDVNAFATIIEENNEIKDLEIKFVFEDEMIRDKKEFSIGEGSRKVSVICTEGNMNSILMGSLSFSSAYRLGIVDISEPELVAELDRIFYSEKKPWCNSDY